MPDDIVLSAEEERRLLGRLRGRAGRRGFKIHRAPTREAHRGTYLLIDANRNVIVRQTDNLDVIAAELTAE